MEANTLLAPKTNNPSEISLLIIDRQGYNKMESEPLKQRQQNMPISRTIVKTDTNLLKKLLCFLEFRREPTGHIALLCSDLCQAKEHKDVCFHIFICSDGGSQKESMYSDDRPD